MKHYIANTRCCPYLLETKLYAAALCRQIMAPNLPAAGAYLNDSVMMRNKDKVYFRHPGSL